MKLYYLGHSCSESEFVPRGQDEIRRNRYIVIEGQWL